MKIPTSAQLRRELLREQYLLIGVHMGLTEEDYLLPKVQEDIASRELIIRTLECTLYLTDLL